MGRVVVQLLAHRVKVAGAAVLVHRVDLAGAVWRNRSFCTAPLCWKNRGAAGAVLPHRLPGTMLAPVVAALEGVAAASLSKIRNCSLPGIHHTASFAGLLFRTVNRWRSICAVVRRSTSPRAARWQASPQKRAGLRVAVPRVPAPARTAPRRNYAPFRPPFTIRILSTVRRPPHSGRYSGSTPGQSQRGRSPPSGSSGGRSPQRVTARRTRS